MPLTSVLAACAGTFFASAGGMVINDYFDYDIDRINRPQRPIPSGRISRKGARFFAFLLFCAAGVCAAFTNIWCILVGFFALFLIILYSWKLKRRLFIGNVVVAFLSALALLYGGIATNSIQLVLILAVIAFFASVSREMAKDIEDIEGDRLYGAQSAPVMWGVGVTAQIAGILLAAAVGTSFFPYVCGIFGECYITMIIPVNFVMSYVVIQLLLKNVEKISLLQKMLKIGMYITLGIFLLSRLV